MYVCAKCFKLHKVFDYRCDYCSQTFTTMVRGTVLESVRSKVKRWRKGFFAPTKKDVPHWTQYIGEGKDNYKRAKGRVRRIRLLLEKYT